MTTIANRKFGIEIEAIGGRNNTAISIATKLQAAGIACRYEGYTHSTTAHWKVVTDASLDGVNAFELVSPILEGQDGIDQIKKVSAVLKANGVKVNSSCGLHVHVDARTLDLDQMKRVTKSYVKHEADFDSLTPAERRNVRWAKGHVAQMGGREAAFKKIDAATNMSALTSAIDWTGDRYHKLNLHSMYRHGTVEFRQHGGTIEAEKMVAWTSLVVNLVDNSAKAKRVTLQGADTFELLISNVTDKTTREFLRARRAKFATA